MLGCISCGNRASLLDTVAHGGLLQVVLCASGNRRYIIFMCLLVRIRGMLAATVTIGLLHRLPLDFCGIMGEPTVGSGCLWGANARALLFGHTVHRPPANLIVLRRTSLPLLGGVGSMAAPILLDLRHAVCFTSSCCVGCSFCLAQWVFVRRPACMFVLAS